MFPLVSVIITTRNEEHNIANCLESVLQQAYFYDKIKIIAVDNNSTDKTKEIVSVIASRQRKWVFITGSSEFLLKTENLPLHQQR